MFQDNAILWVKFTESAAPYWVLYDNPGHHHATFWNQSQIVRTTFPSLHLRHSSFSNPSVVLPTSQLFHQPFRCFSTSQFILQPFFRFSYVTGSSVTSSGETPMRIAYILNCEKFWLRYLVPQLPEHELCYFRHNQFFFLFHLFISFLFLYLILNFSYWTYFVFVLMFIHSSPS